MEEEALSADIMTNTINFTVGWCRPLYSWKLLAAISGGLVSINTKDNIIQVTYQLWFNHLVLVATVILTLAAITLPGKLQYYPLVWLWLVGGNVLIAVCKFRSFIKKCIEEAKQQYLIQKAVLGSNK